MRKLEGDRPCEECPYGPGRPKAQIRTLESTKIAYPDGSEDIRRDPRAREASLEPAPALCGRCPYGPGGTRPPIRTIEVIRTVRAEPGIGSAP